MLRRIAPIADDLLELSVVGSFTLLGYEARRRLYGWGDVADLHAPGRVVAITGATSGLGLATARMLAPTGARLLLLVRDTGKGDAVASELRDAGGSDVGVVRIDLADQPSVRDAAERLRASEERIDAVVHNAGGLFRERTEAPDGHELTFATMVLGPHLLTRELLPALGEGSRVIWVASGGMYTQGLDVDELELGPEAYRGALAYARAKRAQVELTRLWAMRLRDRRVSVHAMHPGWVETAGVREGLPGFSRVMGPLLRDPEQGADTIAWLAVADEPGRSTGRFWLDRRPRPTEKLPGTRADDAERERLWELVERLTAPTA